MNAAALPTSNWTADDVARTVFQSSHVIPRIERVGLTSPLPGYDLWDMWPVQTLDGDVALFGGWTLWCILSTPCGPDPDERHHSARIRLISEQDSVWRDHGNALPEHLNPGSREWAGSAIFDEEHSLLTLYFTAAGEAGETAISFAQRLFSVATKLHYQNSAVSLGLWSSPVECVVSDDRQYLKVGRDEGRPGFIKGFRDPAYFRDPNDNREFLLFTGSLKQSESSWNGCIGLATRIPGQDTWSLLPPLVSADGLNNELERPHIVWHNARYYLFWSTQRSMFAHGGPMGPNGLYGMVSDQMLGPYRPINGCGLVAANPDDAPMQSYSWWVNSDLSVHGFVDLIGTDMNDVQDTAEWRRGHFGGVPAPRFQIVLDGDRAWVA